MSHHHDCACHLTKLLPLLGTRGLPGWSVHCHTGHDRDTTCVCGRRGCRQEFIHPLLHHRQVYRGIWSNDRGQPSNSDWSRWLHPHVGYTRYRGTRRSQRDARGMVSVGGGISSNIRDQRTKDLRPSAKITRPTRHGKSQQKCCQDCVWQQSRSGNCPRVAHTPLFSNHHNTKANHREISIEEGKAFADEIKCPFLETSVKTRENVTEALMSLVREVHRSRKLRGVKIGSKEEKEGKKKKDKGWFSKKRQSCVLY